MKHGEFGTNGKKRAHNFVYNARAGAQINVDDSSHFIIGIGTNWAPEFSMLDEEHGEEEDEDAEEKLFEALGLLSSVDVAYHWHDQDTNEFLTIGAEGFRVLDTEESVEERQRSYGGFAWLEYGWNSNWSAGLMAGRYALRENDTIARSEYAAFLTWSGMDESLLRFQYRFNDIQNEDSWNEFGGDFHEFIMQWTIILGEHHHDPLRKGLGHAHAH